MALKILYTTGMASFQSGAYKILLDMAQGIADQNYEVVLVLPENMEGERPIFQDNHIQAYHIFLPFPRRNESISFYLRYLILNIRGIRSLVQTIHHEKVSIVHVNEIFDIYGAIAAKLAGVYCVWNVRAELSPWPIIRAILPRLVMLLADMVIVASESVRRETFSHPRFDQRKIRVLYDPGLDFAKFHPKVQGCRIRAEFDIEDENGLVVLVAKLSERKGHEVLLQAIPNILKRFPQTYFLIVGGELSGPHHQAYAERLRLIARETGIQENVIFAGFRTDVPEIMAAADIIVHTSTYPDPFPGVVLQAMAVGKPVVASKVGGTLEQIEDGVDGILVEPKKPQILAKAIGNLLENEELRLKIGQAAATRVYSQFNAEQYFKRLRSIYNSLLNE